MRLIYPAALPAPTVEGYAVQPVLGLHRTRFEAGNSRPRIAHADLPETYSARSILTRAQLVTLADFLRTAGARKFWVPLLIPGAGTDLRSVRAQAAGPLSHQALALDVIAAVLPLTVETAPIRADTGDLITPDGSSVLASDTTDTTWESLA